MFHPMVNKQLAMTQAKYCKPATTTDAGGKMEQKDAKSNRETRTTDKPNTLLKLIRGEQISWDHETRGRKRHRQRMEPS